MSIFVLLHGPLRLAPRLLLLAVLIAVVFAQPGAPSQAAARQVIAPALARSMAAQPAGAPTSVIVILAAQRSPRQSAGTTRRERRRAIVADLKAHADRTQASLRTLLRQLERKGRVKTFAPLWVLNAVAVTADPETIQALAARPEVASIVPDSVAASAPPPVPAGAPEPNLTAVGAPDLWAMGYRGQGVVIASLDTGVDATHLDLAPRYRGGSNSWFDPYGQHAAPYDQSGHGTQTMGVMVGGDAGGTTIGVAPQATWIAAKIFNDGGSATASAIHQAFQWLLDPDGNPATDDAPDLVNNSWALGTPGCDLTFEPDLQALTAAGITPVFAAGNHGPGTSTDTSPANNPSALAVGAISNGGAILTQSSRGPTSCGRAAPAAFPSLVAPGYSVYSSDLYGLYAVSSGTSLAAPHMTGGLALLLSAFPGLTVEQQRAALLLSATDLGATGVDSTFGAGRLNLAGAYTALALGQVAMPTAVPPTATAVPPTATAVPPTATAVPPTATAVPPTATAVPPTATAIPPTATAVPPTATAIPATATAAPPTATAVPPTATVVPPTPTAVPPTATPVLPTATPAPVGLFSDGFEGGSLGAWSASATAGGKLRAAPGAALAGSYGMAAEIASATAIYVADGSPTAEATYRARFAFHPNGVVMVNGKIHDLFIGRTTSGAAVFAVQLRYNAGKYQVRGTLRTNAAKLAAGSWYTISNAPHQIEIHWLAATTATGTNGALSLWLDGQAKGTKGAVANGKLRLEEVRLGPTGLSAGISGTEYYDGFASSRGQALAP